MQLSNPPSINSRFQAPPVAASDTTSGSSSSSSNSGTSTATITANDFLQLLVTELQNQDPTANTDPNEYVDQLVQVNTLQQQIQMNQTLDGGPTLTGASSGVLQELVQMNQTLDGDISSANSANSKAAGAIHASAHPEPGNLSAAAHANQQAAAEQLATSLVPNHSHTAAAQNPFTQNQAFEQFAARIKENAPGK